AELGVQGSGRIGMEAEGLGQVRRAGGRQLETIEPGTGQRPLVRKDDALLEMPQPDPADEPLARVLAPRQGEDLVVTVEGRRPITTEDALLDPAAQLARRVPVLLLAVSLREIHPDDVERALRLELRAVRLGDHVIGRRDQVIESARTSGIVEQTADGEHFSHASVYPGGHSSSACNRRLAAPPKAG